MVTRDDLIEQARTAFTEAWEAENKRVEDFDRDARGTHCRSRAGIIAALAVFEESLAPTAAWVRSSPGFESTREAYEHLAPTGDDREALIAFLLTLDLQGTEFDGGSHGNPDHPDRPSWWRISRGTAEAWADALAGFLRSEVPEPSAEHYHIWSGLPCKAGECRMEPQGEPSDAAVERARIIADLREWSRPLGNSPEEEILRLVIERIERAAVRGTGGEQ